MVFDFREEGELREIEVRGGVEGVGEEELKEIFSVDIDLFGRC